MDIDFISLTIFGLATWRAASMLVLETGPWRIFIRVREWSGITHDENDEVMMIPDWFFAGILSCVWCCSMWVGAFWMIIWLIVPLLAIKIATVFAFSAVAILVNRVVG